MPTHRDSLMHRIPSTVPIPSPRQQTRATAAARGVWALVEEWADGADRRAPVPREIVARAAPLLGAARRALSRQRRAEVAPLRPGAVLMPGDLFIRLFQARLALDKIRLPKK